MATGIFSVTLEDLKQQVDEFGLEGKDKTKFLKEEWKKIQDAKLATQKTRFEREVENDRFEQKRSESEAEEKRLTMKAEERQLEKKSERIAIGKKHGRKTIGKRDGRKTIRG